MAPAICRRSKTASAGGDAVGRRARRDALTVAHVQLVDKVARRLARKLPRHVDIDELKSAGMIGLMEAAERFDPNRNEKFEAFATFRIRGAMLDDLRSRDSLSRDMRRICSELRDAAAELANQIGRTPTEVELASHMCLPVEEVRDRHAKLSGWSVVGLDDAGPSFLDRTADDQVVDPIERIAYMELVALIETAVRQLPDRERAAAALRYRDGWRLKEIADALGYTESRACQIMRVVESAIRDEMRRAGMLDAA